MTLSSYPTRVHFADAVMEHALWSEMEKGRVRAALLIWDRSHANTEFHDRIRDGIPPGADILSCEIAEGVDTDLLARRMADGPEMQAVDAIVAFGSVAAIEMGRSLRRELHGSRPAFFAVPGVDGLPDPCNRNLESWRDGLPSVVICDPTLTQSPAPGALLRAAVLTLMRCIESYLGAAYNPPADGMALDGLSRAIAALPQLVATQAGDLDTRRELMAAALNAAMAQEKGIGPAHILARALAAECHDRLTADAGRLILPGIVAATGRGNRKLDTLGRVIGGGGPDIETALHCALDGLPMHARLSDLGLTANHLKRAVQAVAGRRDISQSVAEAVLTQAY